MHNFFSQYESQNISQIRVIWKTRQSCFIMAQKNLSNSQNIFPHFSVVMVSVYLPAACIIQWFVLIRIDCMWARIYTISMTWNWSNKCNFIWLCDKSCSVPTFSSSQFLLYLRISAIFCPHFWRTVYCVAVDLYIPSLTKAANARNVRLYYPYWQYTDLFIFRFGSKYTPLDSIRNVILNV